MFISVEPEEIFDQPCSEEHPSYWLAQLRKKDWIRLLELLGDKVNYSARKPVLSSKALEKLEFQVCKNRADTYRAWQQNPGSFVVQYRHSETDWTRGVPEILPPGMGNLLGFVNVAGRLVCRQKVGRVG